MAVERVTASPIPIRRAGLDGQRLPFDDDTFDAAQMNQGVTQVLTNAPPSGFGLSGVTDVNCPSGQAVVVGSKFNCSLQVEGRQTQVTIEVLSDSGEYRVNPPN